MSKSRNKAKDYVVGDIVLATECPNCAAINKVRERHRKELAELDIVITEDDDKIICKVCDSRGIILTADGHQFLEFLKAFKAWRFIGKSDAE